jgi:hypothetical protein
MHDQSNHHNPGITGDMRLLWIQESLSYTRVEDNRERACVIVRLPLLPFETGISLAFIPWCWLHSLSTRSFSASGATTAETVSRPHQAVDRKSLVKTAFYCE